VHISSSAQALAVTQVLLFSQRLSFIINQLTVLFSLSFQQKQTLFLLGYMHAGVVVYSPTYTLTCTAGWMHGKTGGASAGRGNSACRVRKERAYGVSTLRLCSCSSLTINNIATGPKKDFQRSRTTTKIADVHSIWCTNIVLYMVELCR
jgi:hypothetical protein